MSQKRIPMIYIICIIIKMADNRKEGRLTEKQIGNLAVKLSPAKIRTLATCYMEVTDAIVQTINDDSADNEEFKRELIRWCRNRNAGRDQVKVSSNIFCLIAEKILTGEQ